MQTSFISFTAPIKKVTIDICSAHLLIAVLVTVVDNNEFVTTINNKPNFENLLKSGFLAEIADIPTTFSLHIPHTRLTILVAQQKPHC